MDAVKAAVARHAEAEQQRRAAEKVVKEQAVGPCDEVTIRYPESVETSTVSLLSVTREIRGESLTLKASKSEWTTTLLVPVGIHYFEFLVNGKERKLSSLHETEFSWRAVRWRNKIRANFDCAATLKSYRELPFPRPDFRLIKECLHLSLTSHSSADQASSVRTRRHSLSPERK
jgi:hypothetical protein